MSRPRRVYKDSPVPYQKNASRVWEQHDTYGAGVPCDIETELGTLYLCGACRGWFAPSSKCKGCDFCERCHTSGQPTSTNKHEFTPFGRYCANRTGDKYRGQQEARPSYRDYRGTKQETTRRKSYADAARPNKGTGYKAPDDEDDIQSIDPALDNEAEMAMENMMAAARQALERAQVVPETPEKDSDKDEKVPSSA